MVARSSKKVHAGHAIIASLTASLLLAGPALQPAAVAEESKKEHKSEHKSERKKDRKSKGSAHKQKKAALTSIGLDAETEQLIDIGDWTGAIARLESLTAGSTQADNNSAWLAFGYLFNAHCDKLATMAKRFGIAEVAPLKKDAVAEAAAGAGESQGAKASDAGAPASGAGENIYQSLVKAYYELCQNRMDLAEADLNGLPEKYAADAGVNFARAALAGKQAKAALAAQYCQKTVDAAPGFAWGYRTLGFLQARFLKDPLSARNAYQKAVDLSPNFQEALDSLVDLKLSLNDFDGAIDVANQAIDSAPDNALNYYRLAQIYVRQFRLRDASATMERAIKLDPTEARFYRSRAAIKRSQGDLQGAIADQQKAVDNSHDKAFELAELAALQVQTNQKSQAVDNLKEALKLDPNSVNVRDQLSRLLTDEKRYDELVEVLQAAKVKKPNDFLLLMNLGKALALSGKDEQAISEFKAAVNLEQKNPEPHRQIGTLLVKQKDWDAAAREYTLALNDNFSSVPDLVALGFCLAK
ncbi:MAG TPA: tetratricopeptide repeat protein, partial [Chroococcales cyanobacterium]